MKASDQIWRKTLLNADASINEAIAVLNNVSLKIVLIVNSKGELEGTISDGDIRRGLLKRLNLNSSVELIMHREALVVPPELGLDMVMHLMTANKIQQIPIIDSHKRVIGLHLWDEINSPSSHPNLMIIMAGGRGVRLNPQTENCPKPLLPIAGKPILEHIIERAKVEGFNHFILSVFYLGHMIENYFGNGERLGVTIEYLREDSPLGTAGALSLLDPLPSEPFIVTNGDVITDIRYSQLLQFHKQQNATATMAVRSYEWQNPFGVVSTKGTEIIGYEEKPISHSYINAGVYVLEPDTLKLLKKSQQCDMPTLFALIQENSKKVVAYPIHENWLDVGHPDDLRRANVGI